MSGSRAVGATADLVVAVVRGRVLLIVGQQDRLARLVPDAHGAGRLLHLTV